MTVYRIKLTDFEMRVLINILNEHRLRLKQDGKPIDEIDDLLLKVLDVYEKLYATFTPIRSGIARLAISSAETAETAPVFSS